MEKIFKAKHVDNGDWIEFDILKDSLNHSKSDGGVYDKDKVVREFTTLQKRFSNYDIDKNTICQYTGIDDKEGNRIFEGDEFDCDGICAFKDGAFRYVTEKNNKSLTAGCLNLKLKLTGHNIHDRG